MIGDLLSRRGGPSLNLRTKLGILGALVLLAGLTIFAPTPFSGSVVVADGVRLLSITRTSTSGASPAAFVVRGEASAHWNLVLSQQSSPLPTVSADEGWLFVPVVGSCATAEDVLDVDLGQTSTVRFAESCAGARRQTGMSLFTFAVDQGALARTGTVVVEPS